MDTRLGDSQRSRKRSNEISRDAGGRKIIARALRSGLRVQAGRAVPLLSTVIVSQIALVGSGIVTARLLGVQDRGVFTGATLVPTLVALVTGLSAGATSNVLIAQGHAPAHLLKRGALLVSAATAVPAVLVAFILAQVRSLSLLAAIAIILGTVALGIIPLPVGVSAGSRCYWLMFFCSTVPLSVYSVATITGGLLFSLRSVDFYLEAWGFGLACGLILSLVACYWIVARSPGHNALGRVTYKEMASRGLRSSVASQSPLEAFRGDQLIVLAILGSSALGLYSVALSIANAAKLLGEAFSWRVSHLVVHNPERSTRYLDGGCIALIVFATAIAAVAPFVIPAVFGMEYASSSLTAVVLCVAGGFQACRKLYTEALRSLDSERLASREEMIGVGAFVVLTGIFLLFSGGTTAVGVALAIAALISTAMMRRDVRRLIKASKNSLGPS